MNTLSWFLYFVDISSSIKSAIFLAIMTLAGAIFVSWIRGAIIRDTYTNQEGEEWKNGYLMQWNSLKLLAPIGVLVICACVIPSRETLYMIGASQIGEQIGKLEEVQALGGDMGGLASDAIALLRQNIRTEMEKPIK